MTAAITLREKEGIAILDLDGKLTHGASNSALMRELLNLVDKRRRVILNFRDVSTIDDTAVRTLIFCAEKFRAVGGRMTLLNFSQQLGTLSDNLRLAMTFEIHTKEVEAIQSFFSKQPVKRYDILEFVEC